MNFWRLWNKLARYSLIEGLLIKDKQRLVVVHNLWTLVKSLMWSGSTGASFNQNTSKNFFVEYFNLIFYLTLERTWSSMNWCSMIRARSTLKSKNSIRVMVSFFWQWLRDAVDQTIRNSQDHCLIMWFRMAKFVKSCFVFTNAFCLTYSAQSK